jgi:hypothetical protein
VPRCGTYTNWFVLSVMIATVTSLHLAKKFGLAMVAATGRARNFKRPFRWSPGEHTLAAIEADQATVFGIVERNHPYGGDREQ